MRVREKLALAEEALKYARPSSTGWYRANCPFCVTIIGKTDRKQAFGVLVTTGVFHCFRCGTTGKLDNGVELPELPEERDATACMKPPSGYFPLVECMNSLSAQPAREYLIGRGVTFSMWKSAQIGVCLSGFYQGRVIVPILSEEGGWLGWVGRAWEKHADRAYMYPKGMNRRELLYNAAALRVETETPVLVVEGVFDALAYWPNAVAVLGKPSEPQIEALAAARRPVAIVLDGDAHEEGWALAMKLRFEGQRAGAVKLPPTKDPDEMGREWMNAAVRVALQ